MLLVALETSLFDWDTLFRILLAIVLGGVIGLEREFSGRSAGLRTHILVCVGATIIVLASAAVPNLISPNFQDTLRIDPGRIAAGIVTGIGFLGAGAILRTGEFVRGLTTAACIWFAAALGIVIGEGFFELAVMSTILVLLVLRLDHLFEDRISRPVYRVILIKAKSSQAEPLIHKSKTILKKHRIRIQDMHAAYETESGTAEIKLYLRAPKAVQSFEVIAALKDEPGLLSIRWEWQN